MFNRFVPQSFNLNSNQTLWKLLNRTIYSDSTQWLRNAGPKSSLKEENVPPSEREVIRKLVEDYGFTYLYSEDMMYKVHKITRADLV